MLLFQQRIAHYHTSFFNSSHISILSVLPQCDSAINILFIHPSLITLLLNQLLNKIIPLFSDSIRLSESADRSWAKMPRSQWIAVCIDPIKKMICTSTDGLWMCLITFSSRFSTSNRSFGHLRCAKKARNLHIHQLHSLDSIYSSCMSHSPIRKILWWERCWSWVWWMWRKKWAWWRKEGKATARMVAFVESMMCAGRCSKSPTFGKSNERKNERITHCTGAEGIDRLHFVHQGLEIG